MVMYCTNDTKCCGCCCRSGGHHHRRRRNSCRRSSNQTISFPLSVVDVDNGSGRKDNDNVSCQKFSTRVFFNGCLHGHSLHHDDDNNDEEDFNDGDKDDGINERISNTTKGFDDSIS